VSGTAQPAPSGWFRVGVGVGVRVRVRVGVRVKIRVRGRVTVRVRVRQGRAAQEQHAPRLACEGQDGLGSGGVAILETVGLVADEDPEADAA